MARSQTVGGILVLLSSLLTHCIIFYGNPQIFNTMELIPVFFITSTLTIGTVYLLYPLLGWIGDYITTKYWILLAGVFVLISGLVVSLGLGVLNYKMIGKIQDSKEFPLMVVAVLGLIMLGIGLFESNALQFGVDQISQQSTKKVLTFIKWYFWTHYCGHLIMFYIVLILTHEKVFTPGQYNNETYERNGGGTMFVSSGVLLVFSIFSLCILSWCSQTINNVKHKPSVFKLGTICKIIKYIMKSCLQKPNQQESTHNLTFDACTENHGGHFTIEVVEKAKNTLHIAAIILTCSVIHLSSDTYSLMEQLIQLTNKCPPLWITLLLGINPNHLSYLVVLLVVPIEILVMRVVNFKEQRMLKRIFIGLIFALLALCTQMIINIGALTHLDINITVLDGTVSQLTSTCLDLLDSNTSMDGLESINMTNDRDLIYLFSSIAIPQILNGVAHWLVGMTLLQFICAQASREIQGLLIGGWYSTFAIRFIVIGILDAIVRQHTWWFCYKGVSLALMAIGIFIFVCFAHGYEYRERYDIVNSQNEIATVHVLSITRNRHGSYSTFT